MPSFPARRRAVAAALLVGALIASPALAAKRHITSGTYVRDRLAAISPLPARASDVYGPDTADTASEPSIAVDPTDERHAITVFRTGGGRAIGYAATRDAGLTWSAPALLPRQGRTDDTDIETYVGATDPVVAFGPDGTAYVTFIAFTHVPEGFGTDIKLVRQRPGEATWSQPFPVVVEPLVSGVDSYPDKEWLAVDQSAAPGHHAGRLYVVWSQEPLAPFATYSDDAGETWATPSPILPAVPPAIGASGPTPTHGSDFQALVLRDGSLGVFYDTGDYSGTHEALSAVAEEYRFVRAAAPVVGGERLVFTPPLTVAPAQHRNEPDVANVLDTGTAVVDPESGRIYAAWADSTAATDRNDIVVSTSLDDGSTWSAPRPVTIDATVDAFAPAITVAKHGDVVVAWRARRIEAGALTDQINTVATVLKRGVRQTETLRLNGVVTDPTFSTDPYADGRFFLGDYDQAASGGALTYVARAEAYCPPELAPCATEPAETHQRIWVAVLGAEGDSADDTAGAPS